MIHFFKKDPKIFDYFYVLIKDNGLIEINGKELTKEKVILYIKKYKNSLLEVALVGCLNLVQMFLCHFLYTCYKLVWLLKNKF